MLDYLLEGVLSLIALAVTSYVVPWLKAKLSEEQQSLVSYWVEVLCSAAESLFGSGQGTEKLAWVQEKLAEKGLDVSTEEIEAAVYWMFNALALSDD